MVCYTALSVMDQCNQSELITSSSSSSELAGWTDAGPLDGRRTAALLDYYRPTGGGLTIITGCQGHAAPPSRSH